MLKGQATVWRAAFTAAREDWKASRMNVANAWWNIQTIYSTYEQRTCVAVFKVLTRRLGILYIWNLRMLMRKIVIYLVSRKFYLRGLFLLLKLTELTSTQEYVQRFSNRQIPCLTSYIRQLLQQKSLGRWIFRPTRYIAMFLTSIRRFQICKIPKPRIGTLKEKPQGKDSIIWTAESLRRSHWQSFCWR